MTPLRILILTNRIPYPLHDGGSLAMDAIIRGYHNAGMPVHLLSMNTTRHFVDEYTTSMLYPQIHGFDTVTVNNDLRPVNALKNLLLSNLPEHVKRFQHPAFAKKLQDLLMSFHPDIVQVESPFLSAYMPLVQNARRVMRVHNIEYQIWERLADGKSGIKGWYFNNLAARMRKYEATIWKQYDLLLPITEVDAAIIQHIHPHQRMLVAPYGIEVVAEEMPVNKDFSKAYHIGAMDWLPNAAAIDWMLKEIWPIIGANTPVTEFHFAGRNMPDYFYGHLPPNAYCHGEVTDLNGFYQGKNVLFVPLRAGGGIRIKILEAMAAGKLVISTSIGMQGIDARPGIHYLAANTAEEFAAIFNWANEHVTEANEICRSAYRLVTDRYSNEAIVDDIIAQLYLL